MNLYSPSGPPPPPSNSFSLALRNQQLKGFRSRKVIQKSHFKARLLSSQAQGKVLPLWQLQVMLKEDQCLVPEVPLSEAQRVCSSSHLFLLSQPVATGEVVRGATGKTSQAKGNTKEIVQGEFYFTHLRKKGPLLLWGAECLSPGISFDQLGFLSSLCLIG